MMMTCSAGDGSGRSESEGLVRVSGTDSAECRSFGGGIGKRHNDEVNITPIVDYIYVWQETCSLLEFFRF